MDTKMEKALLLFLKLQQVKNEDQVNHLALLYTYLLKGGSTLKWPKPLFPYSIGPRPKMNIFTNNGITIEWAMLLV